MPPQEPRTELSRAELTRTELSRAEIAKDAAQDLTAATAGAVSRVTQIVTGAVVEIAGVVGDLATEAFEVRDSVRRARADQDEASDDA